MPARYKNSCRFNASPFILQNAVQGALNDLGAGSIAWSADDRQVTAKIGVNFSSWGENITAVIDPSGEVVVESACLFPLQIFDWGKNANNCHNFLEAVGRRLTPEIEIVSAS